MIDKQQELRDYCLRESWPLEKRHIIAKTYSYQFYIFGVYAMTVKNAIADVVYDIVFKWMKK